MNRSLLSLILLLSVSPVSAIEITPDEASIAKEVFVDGLPVDPLPSWNESASKNAIMAFVQKVTAEGSTDFVPISERIAVFDNDGTLWPENPVPFQVAYALDMIKQRSATDPILASNPMVQAANAGDLAKLLEGAHHDGLMQVMALTHAGMTTEEFRASVESWLKKATHPRFAVGYDQLTYQPMQEVLTYLRDKGFKTYIVSGGGADFMRVWSERVYGIPPEQVIGSSSRTKFELRENGPILVKTLEHLFVDDKEGKPIGIHQFIGRRPIACFGNSDGDKAMMEYTTMNNPRPSFGLIVHHTDSEREYAYDKAPKSSGKLVDALADSSKRGWEIVDMAKDWKTVWSAAAVPGATVATQSIVGNWLAEDIAGGGVLDRAQSTLQVSEDGTVTGNTAVNRYGGKAVIAGQKITFGPLAMTRRAGPPAMMDQESKFKAALEKVASFRIDDTGLMYLLDAEGKNLLRFSKLDK
ncbi:MAG: META domain-containing protein [Planctomycetota bacterium]|nr:META domain-containing protein [Planctomycetota bacterium]